jgi:endonuclease G
VAFVQRERLTAVFLLGIFLDPAPVIGGSNASTGQWPDVAAVLYRQIDGTEMQMCTGTLVAPTVVLTAGHCDPSIDPNIGTLDNVLLGTTSLARPQDGEILPVASIHQYPSSQSSEDVTVLVLAQPAHETPRAIATGWARLDIINGASVELVGYGSIDKNGSDYVNELQEAKTTITDADCSMSSGCYAAAQPAGELGAGGMGIDTCPGDSGGPLYLLPSYGKFLAGVTSRSYDNATVACGQGGIYERPDKIVNWIEQVAGVPVTHGPEPTADPIMAVRGDAGETMITADDPKADSHTFTIVTPPAHGIANVRGDGRVRVCTDPTATGSDSVTVNIANGARALSLTIPIAIADGSGSGSCDVTKFSVPENGGGCCSGAGGDAGSIPMALGVLAVVLRSRRGRNVAEV